MPAIALLSPEVWEALKLANIRGVTDEALSKQFDISQGAIRAKRFKDPAWRGAMADQRIAQPKQQQANAKVTEHAVSTVVTANLAEIHSGTATKLAQAAAVALGTFAQKPAAIESWADASTAYKVQRLACGMDKEGTTVNIGLGSWGAVAVQSEDGQAGFREVGPESGEQDVQEG